MTLTPMLDFCTLDGFLCKPSLLFGTCASASRVRAPAKGRQTVAIICLVGDGRAGDAECFIKGGRVGMPSPGAGC